MIRATLAALSVNLLAVLLVAGSAGAGGAVPAHDRGHRSVHSHAGWKHHHKATLDLLGIH